ncbi:MAG: FAD-binding protein [Nocardioidaceae bacterium]
MVNTYDAIVVGGGHNGLVAAAHLAKAGLRAVVHEARRSNELYDASSATHAGGGVCGIPGMQAARAVLRDARGNRRSPRRWLTGHDR